MTTHYSWGQAPQRLIPWAKQVAQRLVLKYGIVHLDSPDTADRLPVLMYRGMSGTAHATALMLALVEAGWTWVPMAYVRKPEERSHGIDIEHNLSHLNRNEEALIPLIVDDMVATGGTYRAIFNAMLRHQWHLHLDARDLRCTQECREWGSRDIENIRRAFNDPAHSDSAWWVDNANLREHLVLTS